MKEVLQALSRVQKELKAPKNQFNSFGKYKYRSCEDILEAAKPLCILNDLLLTLSDKVINVGQFNYIEATATVVHISGQLISATASARESVTKKGMDDSQITGTASSYARKYALNGLFCIDDTKDADTDQHATQQTSSPQQEEKPATAEQRTALMGKVLELKGSGDDRSLWLSKQLENGMSFKMATEILEKLK